MHKLVSFGKKNKFRTKFIKFLLCGTKNKILELKTNYGYSGIKFVVGCNTK